MEVAVFAAMAVIESGEVGSGLVSELPTIRQWQMTSALSGT
jgi:hypothetical protein